jgi:putative transposase
LGYRATVILAAATGKRKEHMAQQRGLKRHTVRTWRRRCQTAVAALAEAEAAGVEAKVLRARIEAVLDDAPRPGTPETFRAEQLAQLISVACESPEESVRPVTQWRPRELAAEASYRGIVASISVRTVGRFLTRRRA